MLFTLKRGKHYQRGKVYKKGDIVESPNDLAAMFGEAKFERDFETEKKAGIITVSKPKISPPVDKGEDEVEDIIEETTSEPLSAHGKDVTSEFPTAGEVGVKVFENSKWFTIVDEQDGEVLNEKKLRGKDVESFLRQYLGEDED